MLDRSQAERGGIIFAPGSGAAPVFIPSDVAIEVTELSALLPIVGAVSPLVGVALAHGEVVTVLSVAGEGPPSSVAHAGSGPAIATKERRWGHDGPGPGSDRAVICDAQGDAVALTGGTVLATGLFEAESEGTGVVWRGAVTPELDVRGLYAEAKAAVWRARREGATR